jgi:hypothetical protein
MKQETTVTCGCGATHQHRGRTRHEKTKKHQNWVQKRLSIQAQEAEADKHRDMTANLPINFWKTIEDRFESDLSFNSYTQNLDILLGEWSDTRMFNKQKITEDALFDMEHEYIRMFKEQLDEEKNEK